VTRYKESEKIKEGDEGGRRAARRKEKKSKHLSERLRSEEWKVTGKKPRR